MFLDSPARRFALVFGIMSGSLLSAYYFPYANDTAMRGWLDAYLRGYAALAGGVLRWFEPTLRVEGQNIVGRSSLRIVKTCDAMDVQILFLSAVLAWPGRRLVGGLVAAAGVLGLFVINVIRICSLYYIALVVPSWFDFAHLELWPAAMVVAAVAGFVAFTLWGRAANAAPPSGADPGRARAPA